MVFELHTRAEQSKICRGKLHATIYIHAKAYFRTVVWSRSGFSISTSCARVQITQCGEKSATLAETECSVSSVGVQSKGSFQVFLIINV